ncbi:4-coumarate--CoA ligase family protein [Pseudoclavibacter chungangensis]|uniref:4-coumarate--CoA ligase family protein n=1 Tax=Pseudoclavibacter chungangensis TaxID=587635 RepID=A0A7J5C0U2_9MICO|nr:AMP-binding protein [Pseudoclavibacter chungangensis]KAB1662234.1 4-coumarate--CoA ligase family protein [Pseudoclavibacter chungangensis]NYJ65437.1 acyl-CoA synthetase (AMP-forming)/AMP-acid ligase II [Pseudoclavibacter chungangensis]
MYRSTLPDVVVPDVSVFDSLFGSLTDEDREKTALVDGPSGAETSYGDLAARIEAVAGALAARGIGVGDVVALHCPNSSGFVIAFHGILRAGATATTVNSLATVKDLESQLRASGAELLLTASPLLEAATTAARNVGLPDSAVIVLDGAEGHESLRDLLAAGAPAPDVSFEPAEHLAVLPYSSGTTGLPKGVMLTHRNLVANVEQARAMLGVGRDDVLLAVLPFFHIYGMTALLNLGLRERATLVTMPRFDLAEFLRLIEDHGVTYLFIAPPIGVALAKHPLVDTVDTSTVRHVLSGAAPLDEHLGRAIEARLGARMLQGYGMTEMSPVSHVTPFDRDDISPGSVGLAIPNVEFRLVDPATGEDVEVTDGVSAPGELWCRGPMVMTGYLNNPEATAETLTDDGWLKTGDVATVDADGVVHIVDRLKELIKYKGYQVAPSELESLLLEHPGIADAAVVGVLDDEGEEVPKAFVVAQPGTSTSDDEVLAFVAERVAPYKKVRVVEWVDAIPKSASGKILRKDLRAPAATA